MQIQQLQNALRIGRQRFMFVVGILRRRDLHQLHFIELMDANDPARFAPGRAGFAPKAGRVSDKFFRQIRRRENFFAMKICHRHLRGRREEQLVLLQPVHVVLKFRQLRRADHAIAPHEKWRAHFEVAMLARVQIEHEIDQRALQLRARAGETNEPAPAQFRGALQIEKLQLRSRARRDPEPYRRDAAFRPNCAPPDWRSHLCRPAPSACGKFGISRSRFLCCSSAGERLLVQQSNLIADFAGHDLPVPPDDSPRLRLPPISLLNLLRSALQLLQRGFRFAPFRIDAQHFIDLAPRRRRRGWRAGFSQNRAVRE